MGRLNNWAKRYEPYTAVPDLTVSEDLKKVNELDEEGRELLIQIAKEWKKRVKKYQYYSIGKDEFQLEIYPDGTEKYFGALSEDSNQAKRPHQPHHRLLLLLKKPLVLLFNQSAKLRPLTCQPNQVIQ